MPRSPLTVLVAGEKGNIFERVAIQNSFILSCSSEENDLLQIILSVCFAFDLDSLRKPKQFREGNTFI